MIDEYIKKSFNVELISKMTLEEFTNSYPKNHFDRFGGFEAIYNRIKEIHSESGKVNRKPYKAAPFTRRG